MMLTGLTSEAEPDKDLNAWNLNSNSSFLIVVGPTPPMQPPELMRQLSHTEASNPEPPPPPPSRPPPPFSDKSIDDWNRKINYEFNNIYDTLHEPVVRPDVVQDNLLAEQDDYIYGDSPSWRPDRVHTPVKQIGANNCLPIHGICEKWNEEPRLPVETVSWRIDPHDYLMEGSIDRKKKRHPNEPTQAEVDLFIRQAEAEASQDESGRGSWTRHDTLLPLNADQLSCAFYF